VDERECLAERFEKNRTRLRAVAYRMLGSLSEACGVVTLNEVKGTMFGMVPFAALRVTYGRARTYFIASRISPAAAMALSTSRESALACCVAWVRSPSTAATPAERSRSRSKRTFCIASTQDSR
jgi:hypothetical protein